MGDSIRDVIESLAGCAHKDGHREEVLFYGAVLELVQFPEMVVLNDECLKTCLRKFGKTIQGVHDSRGQTRLQPAPETDSLMLVVCVASYINGLEKLISVVP